jgi:hypothetical protein
MLFGRNKKPEHCSPSIHLMRVSLVAIRYPSLPDDRSPEFVGRESLERNERLQACFCKADGPDGRGSEHERVDATGSLR